MTLEFPLGAAMKSPSLGFADLTDRDLLEQVSRLVVVERRATGNVIAALMELDRRRLYLGAGCSSLFTYCTQVLRLSEHAAYGRIQAARAAQRFPSILSMLVDGSVTLTTIGLLAPHLTPENHVNLLAAATHKSKREIEVLVAGIRPQAPIPTSVRKLSEPKALEARGPAPPPAEQVALMAPGARPHAVTPLAPERYKIQITVGRETYEKLRRAQDLLRHSLPTGEAAQIFDRALTALLAELSRKKTGATDRPRAAPVIASRSRHIPAAVRRRVWARDGGRCAFVGTAGRCRETGFLEFHHVVPFAVGGESTVENVELRCRAHNVYEGEKYFGLVQPLFIREVGQHFFEM